jgi:hypothetical protein
VLLVLRTAVTAGGRPAQRRIGEHCLWAISVMHLVVYLVDDVLWQLEADLHSGALVSSANGVVDCC